jgi:cyclophilin family peptidyl-prolyl cis-trans isomerase
MKRIVYVCVLSVLAFSLLSCGKKGKEKVVDKVADTTSQTTAEPTKPVDKIKMSLELDSADITNEVVVRTSMGSFSIGLFGKDAPKTVKNFLGLVRKGFYNGILIHRVAKDFLIQFGDRNTINRSKKNDWGKGGQSFSGKPLEDEMDHEAPSYRNGYLTGVVAMANRGPNTGTSQLFVCLDDAIELEKKWTIFGAVTEGMDIVRQINSVEVVPGLFEKKDGLPVVPIKILSVAIKK